MTAIHRAGTVSAATLSGLALTLGLAHAVAPQWSRQLGLDVWNLNAARLEERSVRDEANELRVKAERLRQDLELADALMVMLAAGHICLAEATDQMEPSLRARPGFEVVALAYLREPTLRHGVARYLITRVARHLSEMPAHRAIVSARLEAEYAALQ